MEYKRLTGEGRKHTFVRSLITLNSVNKEGLKKLYNDLHDALADYEDSGLSPAEAKEIKRALDGYGQVYAIVEKMKDVSSTDGEHPEYKHDGYVVTEIPAFIGFLKSLRNIGKTLFFTHEAAEKVLIKEKSRYGESIVSCPKPNTKDSPCQGQSI